TSSAKRSSKYRRLRSPVSGSRYAIARNANRRARVRRSVAFSLRSRSMDSCAVSSIKDAALIRPIERTLREFSVLRGIPATRHLNRTRAFTCQPFSRTGGRPRTYREWRKIGNQIPIADLARTTWKCTLLANEFNALLEPTLPFAELSATHAHR